ncbi:hypothetical protein NDU88_004318 [Pleurodeles waltl]|uniref:Uncharacterized protein n=1 Tax=Pleurodeles waltl TaxID=8319 RepID=A0AAV7NKR5_PLEWA|nr:hypothetical protein NDU88_004318 [Pleurodeles waltl]
MSPQCSAKKYATLKDIFAKPLSKKSDQSGEELPPAKALEDIATLKQAIAVDEKGIGPDLGKLGQRINFLEQITHSRAEVLEEYRHELLELQDKNLEFQYQLEHLENRSHRLNIRIQGVPLQAMLGNLEDSHSPISRCGSGPCRSAHYP